MRTFVDAENRSWSIAIDAPTIKRVRAETGIDLMLIDSTLYERLSADVVLLVDVLWSLVRPQAANVSDEEFGRALVGDPIECAAKSLIGAVADFFPYARRARWWAMVEIAKAKDTARAMMLAEILVRSTIPQADGGGSTNQPAEPESTQATA